MMTTDDDDKKEDKKEEEEEKKEENPDELTEAEKETIDQEADKKFYIELEAIIVKIVEKSQFLIQMQVPLAYKIKEKKKEGTIILIKDTINEDHVAEHDWKDRLKQWK